MGNTTQAPPNGGAIFLEFQNREGLLIPITYYELWTLIVCRTSLGGNWERAKQAASMVMDAPRKRALVERLSRLAEQGSLPEIPIEIQHMHLQRAHRWFKGRPVVGDQND
jgi:hypothetical protein